MIWYSWLIVLAVTACAEATQSANCPTHQFLCDDNTTISWTLLCNGLHDCADGSDETATYCRRVICQPGYLKCDYGACVRDRMLCGKSLSPALADANAGCRISRLPNNGHITYAADPSSRLDVGEMVPNFVGIRYGCLENYYIIGNTSPITCLDNEWSNANVPDCQLRCHMKEISSITFTTSCYRVTDDKRQVVRCGPTDLVETGVNVIITCKAGYQSATSIDQLAQCGTKGQWNRRINPCVQICGEEGAEGSTLIVSGQVTNNTKVPWHVGIYRQGGAKGEDLEYICGGTILNPRLVVSAVHCFWDVTSEAQHPTSQYRVVAGKFYRRLNDPREKNSFQILHVKDIHYPKGYNHYDGLFANDVAVLVLESFIEFKPHVAPACMNYRYDLEDKVIPHGKIGRVAGWGLIQSNGELSNELKSVELPVVERDACRSHLTRPSRPFLTGDKYCAGYLNMNVGVCQGDSGGGMVFAKWEGDKNVFYLRGLVSSGPNQGSSCDSNQYAFFTNTAHFQDLIEHYDLSTKPEYVDIEEPPSACSITVIPVNGYAMKLGEPDRNLTVGEQIVHGGAIRYRCANEWNLSGSDRNTCQDGQWTATVPICEKAGKEDNLSCHIDATPQNGWIEMSQTPHTQLNVGESVERFTQINYRCSANHAIDGPDINYCFNGQWRFSMPNCRPLCSTDTLNQVSYRLVNCVLNATDVPCDIAMRPGTMARVTCGLRYELLDSELNTQITVCNASGQWSPPPRTCNAICGEESPQGVPFIVGGADATIAQAPWHANIYKRDNETSVTAPRFICGGTIANARVIITAIHCLYDRFNDNVYSASLFVVGVGKSTYEFATIENLKPQFSNVERIYYDSDYHDAEANFQADIAIIVLKSVIEFRSHIAPICLPFGLSFDEKAAPVGQMGRLAGFGLTEPNGKQSETLKIIEMPVVSRSDCLKHLPNNSRRIVTSDKFCAGFADAGIAPCLGDSGGGFVIKETVRGREKFFLRGILSGGPNKDGSCHVDTYTFYTNIPMYETLISLYETRYRPR